MIERVRSVVNFQEQKQIFYLKRTQHILIMVIWRRTYGNLPHIYRERKAAVDTT